MAPLRSSSVELGDGNELPYIDEHSIRIPASRGLVSTALQRYVARSLVTAGSSRLRRTWGLNLRRAPVCRTALTPNA